MQRTPRIRTPLDYQGFDLELLLTHTAKLLLAFLLVMPVALEREYATESMGLRTFPLVAVASCGYLLLASAILGDDPVAHSRVLAGLMTGMGFIGGGAILKNENKVQGTATAASLWTTGVVGASVAHSLYEMALVIAALNFITLKVLTPIERRIRRASSGHRRAP